MVTLCPSLCKLPCHPYLLRSGAHCAWPVSASRSCPRRLSMNTWEPADAAANGDDTKEQDDSALRILGLKVPDKPPQR